jgi:hypothetical protein
MNTQPVKVKPKPEGLDKPYGGKIIKTMSARTADPAERDRLWPKLVAHYPDFASYESWTNRAIPVVILEPAS